MSIEKVKEIKSEAAGNILFQNKSTFLASFFNNDTMATFNAALSLESLQASSASTDNSLAKKEISHQILLEPAKAISANTMSNQVIENNTTAANSFLKEVPDKLEKAGELSQNKPAVDNKVIKDCVKSAAKKCSTVVENEAVSGELAHGNVFSITHGNQITAANSIKVHSDTNYSLRSPAASVNTQDYIIQANNSSTTITDTLISQTKNSVEFAENSKITQSSDSLNVATNASDYVSKHFRTIGVEQNTSMGKTNQIVADEKMLQVSGNSFSQASYGDFSTQSNGNINIIASKGSKEVGTIFALGHDHGAVDFDEVAETFNSINIINDNISSNNIFSLSNKGNLFTTTGNSTISASGSAVVSGDKGVVNYSNKVVYLGGPSGGVIVKGNKLFLNSIPLPIGNFSPPKVLELPPLPEFPDLPSQELENCIPDKFKPKGLKRSEPGKEIFSGRIEDFEDGLFNGDKTTPPFIEEGSLPTVSDDIEGQLRRAGVNNDIPSDSLPTVSDDIQGQLDRAGVEREENSNKVILNPTPEDIVTSRNNKKKSSIVLTKPGNVASENQVDRKLPGVTVKKDDAVGASNFTKIDASAMTGGGFNIYMDKINTDSYNNVFKLMQKGIFAEGASLYKVLESEEELELFAADFKNSENQVNELIIYNNLQSFLPNSVIEKYSDPAIYIALSTLSPEEVKSFKITKDSFGKDVSEEVVKKALDLIKLYPQSYPGIKNIINIINSIPAIGFLSLASSLLGGFGGLNISESLFGNINGIINIPNFVSNEDYSSIYSLTKPVLSDIFSGSIVGDIIDNPTLNNIGKEILSGEDASTVLEKNIRNTIESELLKRLPGNLKSTIPTLKNLIINIQSNKPLDETQLIQDISSALGNITGIEDLKLANKVYSQIKDVIKVVNGGDLLKLITGTSLEGLVSTLGGNKNKSFITDIFGLLRDTVGTVEAIKLLPELIDLMNQYNIPGLEQINIALSCLDLFNKIRNLLDRVKGLTSKNKSAASLIEQSPRIIQGINSINDSQKDSQLNDLIKSESGDRISLEEISTLEIPLSLDLCFKVPVLTLSQADVEIISVEKGVVQFSMKNSDFFLSNNNYIPKLNDVLQIRVESYYKNIDYSFLTPYQTEFQYTPSILNFIIANYDLNNNLGIAVFDASNGSLILEADDGILYEFNSADLGSSLELNIDSAYLLA
jgi:hypothetical protein